MPSVGSKKFPYSNAGKKAAASYAKKSGKAVKAAKPKSMIKSKGY
jgi:hypothetical protein